MECCASKDVEKPTMEIAIVGDGKYAKAIELLKEKKYQAVVVYWLMDNNRHTYGALRVFCRDEEIAEKLKNEIPGSCGRIGEREGYPLLDYPVSLASFVADAEFPMGAKLTLDTN